MSHQLFSSPGLCLGTSPTSRGDAPSPPCALTLWNRVRHSPFQGGCPLVSATALQHSPVAVTAALGALFTCPAHLPGCLLVGSTSERHKERPHEDLEVSEETQLTHLLLPLSHQQGHVPHPGRGTLGSPKLLSVQGLGMSPFTAMG